jgi:hypothetical protein
MYTLDNTLIGDTPAGMIEELKTYSSLFNDRLKIANAEHRLYNTQQTKAHVKAMSAIASKCLNALRHDAKTKDVGFALIEARKIQAQAVGM